MFDSVLTYLDKFGPELLVIQFGFLIILSTLFLWLWFANRRKYHNMKHAIPANVVKNYLDSIIQNSTALKSSLTRGGGQELDSIPSVMALTSLRGGESVGVDGSQLTAYQEQIHQQKAQIASLEAQLRTSQSAVGEFETKVRFTEGQLGNAHTKIKELETLISGFGKGGDDEVLKKQIEAVIKERDEVVDRLREFEIIADDLANLKRLQQENEQLKRSLNAQNKQAEAPDVEEAVETYDEPVEEVEKSDDELLESFLSSPDESEDEVISGPESESIETLEVSEALAPENEEIIKSKDEKTPEDLLSEFEKMLG